MAKVEVTYTARITQTLDWPDDELDDFNYNNLQANLEPTEDDIDGQEFDILDVKLNGQDHSF
jgi:hypothetical protein